MKYLVCRSILLLIGLYLFESSAYSYNLLKPLGTAESGSDLIELFDEENNSENSEKITGYIAFVIGDRRIRFSVNGYTKGKLICTRDDKDKNIVRIHPVKGSSKSHLEIKRIENEIVVAFIDFDIEPGIGPKRIGEFHETMKPDEYNQRFPILETYLAGRELIDLANGISNKHNREEGVFELLEKLAVSRPSLKSVLAKRTDICDFAIYFPENVSNRIHPVYILRDKVRNSRFVALVDENNPDNRIVFESYDTKTFLLNGNEKVEMPDEDAKQKKQISLYNLKSIDGFAKKLTCRKLAAINLSKYLGYNSGVSFARGISLNFKKSLKTRDNLKLITLAHRDMAGRRSSFPIYLVDLGALEEFELKGNEKETMTLEEVNDSNGKYIAFKKTDIRVFPEWLTDIQQDRYEYFRRIVEITDKETVYEVYRRLDQDDRITSIHIADDNKTFTVEGLEINSKPIVFKAMHFHLSLLLYAMCDYIETYNIEKIVISESLKNVAINNLEEMIEAGWGSVPLEFVPENIDGEEAWFAKERKKYYWNMSRTDDLDVKERKAKQALLKMQDNLFVFFPVSMRSKPALEIGQNMQIIDTSK
ncbi:MAG: hypothetical protein ABII27_06845 [bacterium]